jgi:hypothetical protein
MTFRIVPDEQRGIVLLVALIGIVASTLGGIALVRTVATDVAIGGNLALRQQATLAASVAVEHDLAALFESGAIADRTADDPARNYFASRHVDQDARGVPRMLQSVSSYPAGVPSMDAGDGLTLRHVIERLCLRPGAATPDNCTLSPRSVAAAPGAPSAPEPPPTPYYRVTVRIDGPAGAAAFVQVMLGEEASHHRLAWRVLDE